MRPCSAPALSLLTLGTLLLGCSDPDDPPSTGDATGSSSGGGSDVGETEPATTPPADSTVGPDTDDTDEPTDGPTDSTGPGDAPPVIDAFTIDGSTMPAELQSSGMVAIDVDVTDDIGIDRVEIFDGDELVATLPSQPYQTELLLSSADNGGHLYTAVAYDTSEQTATSDVVALSVNVVGGEMLVLRDQIGEVRVASFWAPKLAASGNGIDIVATASGVSTLGLAYWRYDASLSLVGETIAYPPGGSPYTLYNNGWTPPAVSGNEVLVGMGANGPGGTVAAIGRIDPRVPSIAIDTHGSLPSLLSSQVAVDGEGNVIFMSAEHLLEKRTVAGAVAWQVPVGGDGAFVSYITTTSTNDVVLALSEPDCGPLPGAECVLKLTPAGMVSWTRNLPSLPHALAVSADDEIVAVTADSSFPVELVVFDGVGNEVVHVPVNGDPELATRSIFFDPQGHLMLAGHRFAASSYGAWASRIDLEGNVLWSEEYTIGTQDGFTGVTVTPSGRVYVVGFEDRFDFTLFDFAGDAFVAELAL